MAQKSSGGKIALVVLIVLVAGAAAFGYFKQTHALKTPAAVPAAQASAPPTAAPIDVALLAPKPNDIIIGDANAMVTIVEYSSLSCPHCAHFHKDVLPDLDKEFLSTGKAKLVIRHFPLNEPALKAAELVECSGNTGGQRSNFEKVLFEMQAQWAFDDNYLKELKQIALVGGIDSAAFDSCLADKDLEARIVATRQEAGDKLGVNSTPTFFINGKRLESDFGIENFRKAIADASAVK